MDLKDKRIVLTGGTGFLGKHVHQELLKHVNDHRQVVVFGSKTYDLVKPEDTERMYQAHRPDVVIHLAATVGGIGANQKQPGLFFYNNMAMALNVIEGARRHKIEKLVMTGTVCSYPKFAPVPFKEETIWDGYPEKTNAPYGIAKRAAMEMLQAYHKQYGLKSAFVVPVNLYGPHDNFDLETSHVIPAIIRKLDEAMKDDTVYPMLKMDPATGEWSQTVKISHVVEMWGTGDVSREFLHVSDAARGIVAAAEKVESPKPINLGTGQEIRIYDLAHKIGQMMDFSGTILWDPTKPNGQPRRKLDTSLAKHVLDWEPRISLDEGLSCLIGWWRAEGSKTTR